ncbi:MAG: hypothetical protein JKY61_09855 [Planctomycetes bacterium]|nr:hypothetical protein [Planctomycetota bacterium]
MTSPSSDIQLLSKQLGQRSSVILAMTEKWSASQALIELHPGGPSGQSLFLHLIEVTRSTLSALDLEVPFPGPRDTWQQLRGEFESAAEKLTVQVAGLSHADLQAEPAIEILPDFKQSLSTRHAFLLGHVFHLGYHAGQLGSIAAMLDPTP